MKSVRAQAELLARAGVHVLIVGEEGTGKETTARLIHELSDHRDSRLVKVSCDAVPGHQLERELFGCETKSLGGGSFHKPGKLEHCAGTALLLREILEMPASLQARMVSVLQRPGLDRGRENRSLEIRILGTTRTDPDQASFDHGVKAEFLRLFSAFTIHVPPLRQRREDIPLLLGHFMKRLASHYRLPPRKLPSGTLEACERYAWPGNTTELENFVKAYLILGDKALLMLGDVTQSSRTRIRRWSEQSAVIYNT
jgi:two-component system, NtrC family, response regulator AtoC